MKLNYYIITIIFALILTGCSTEQLKRSFVSDFNYFTDTTPTLESLKKN